MITHVTQSEFIDTFRTSHSYKNNFSYDALIALFEYLEQYEEDIGDQITFDMTAICCEYTEYKNIKDFLDDYSVEYFSGPSYLSELHNNIKNANTHDEIINAIREETEVIEFDGRTTDVFVGNISTPDKSFIIRNF